MARLFKKVEVTKTVQPPDVFDQIATVCARHGQTIVRGESIDVWPHKILAVLKKLEEGSL